MSQQHKFHAVIEDPGGGGAFVTVPFDVEKTFSKKRVKIIATIDGEPYRGSLVRMGSESHLLIILKEIRKKIGKTFGDQVEIIIEEDIQPRVVEIPPDLITSLEKSPSAAGFFQQLSYTHQKEYVDWILDAKRAETRQRRIIQAVELLEQGKRGH
jgi:hypothetical protein